MKLANILMDPNLDLPFAEIMRNAKTYADATYTANAGKLLVFCFADGSKLEYDRVRDTVSVH